MVLRYIITRVGYSSVCICKNPIGCSSWLQCQQQQVTHIPTLAGPATALDILPVPAASRWIVPAVDKHSSACALRPVSSPLPTLGSSLLPGHIGNEGGGEGARRLVSSRRDNLITCCSHAITYVLVYDSVFFTVAAVPDPQPFVKPEDRQLVFPFWP